MTVAFGRRLTALAAAPGLSRRTIRMRLTLIYGGLFLICGAGLLAITYVLVSNATAGYFSSTGPNGFTVGGYVGSHGAKPRGGPPGLQVNGPRAVALSPGQAQAVAGQMQALAVSQHASELHQLLIYSGVALAIMAMMSVGFGWVMAGRVLRPLRTITAAARDISATSLHRRLALKGPDDELKELGDIFDDLLSRLEASFRSQRQFVANASHELRTPLAWQRTLVQVALADPGADAASLRAAHDRVLASGGTPGTDHRGAAHPHPRTGRAGQARTLRPRAAGRPRPADPASRCTRPATGHPHRHRVGPGSRRPEAGRTPDRQPRGQRAAAQHPRRPHRSGHGNEGLLRRTVGNQHRAPRPGGSHRPPPAALPAARPGPDRPR